MDLIKSVLKNAERTVNSNIESLRQTGLKKFVRDTGLDINGMSVEDLQKAYEEFKNQNVGKLVNGEYLGDLARNFEDVLTYSEEEIKKQVSQISINGVKIDTQQLLTSPDAALRSAAEGFVDKEIDKVVQSKVGDILAQAGVITDDNQVDQIKELIRNTIRGTKNSIFRDPEIKQKLLDYAQGAVNNYYQSVVQMLESPDWAQKQLKPLNDMVDKGFGELDKATGEISKISGEIDKYANKLSELEKLDIAKEINGMVTGQLDIEGNLTKLNSQLGMFGLDQSSIGAISGALNASVTNTVTSALGPTIQNSITQLGDINKEVAKVQEYVKQYEDYVKKEIQAFESKAKDYIKQLESELISSILSSVHLKLGDSLKIDF